jgi:regulator of cell morphogenesis and NO signaling
MSSTDRNDESLDLARASMTDLVGHILQHYHDKLRVDLPRLTALGQKVIDAHGERHREVRQVAAVVADLRAELESHLMKEERILFPFIAQLETGAGAGHPMLGHVASPIRVMEAEHDHAWAALATLRKLTSGYAPPANACATFRDYYESLSILERELHEHIHLENNVLFPRAQAMEDEVLGRP